MWEACTFHHDARQGDPFSEAIVADNGFPFCRELLKGPQDSGGYVITIRCHCQLSQFDMPGEDERERRR